MSVWRMETSDDRSTIGKEYEKKFQETEKFHVRKVKCLVSATEKEMSVWWMETSDDRSTIGKEYEKGTISFPQRL